MDDGPWGSRYKVRLLPETLAAPEIIDLEVASVVRKMVLDGKLSSDRAGEAVMDLAGFPVTRLSHRPLLPRIWELRPNVTAYDAAYVACAETLQVPLRVRS